MDTHIQTRTHKHTYLHRDNYGRHNNQTIWLANCDVIIQHDKLIVNDKSNTWLLLLLPLAKDHHVAAVLWKCHRIKYKHNMTLFRTKIQVSEQYFFARGFQLWTILKSVNFFILLSTWSCIVQVTSEEIRGLYRAENWNANTTQFS